jgi:hypothetical protein
MKNIELATQVADGWLPSFFSPRMGGQLYGSLLDGARPGFDVCATTTVVMGADIDACRAPVKYQLALYVGGMGARGKTSTTTLPFATDMANPR